MLVVFAKENRQEAKQRYGEAMALVASMGRPGRKFRREATRRTRAIVSELYSAPRVTDAARRHARFGILPGLGLDLTGTDEDGGLPWDFNEPKKREKAERLIEAQRPVLLICTPMRTAFSNIQNLNKMKRDPKIVAAELGKAREHLKWCCALYKKQVERGAYFLHEHPAHATSWKTPEIEEVLGIPGVGRIIADRCQLGQQTEAGDPLKKPTGLLSNAQHLLRELDRRCFGKHGLCSRPHGGSRRVHGQERAASRHKS